MASDKLFNRTGAFGDSTLGDGDPVTPAYLAGVDENALMLGRNRYTAAATVLQQSDCEAGASQVQPGDRLFRYFRLSGTATADDATRLALSTPVRGSWHSDDNSGAVPALDDRTAKGDSCQIDTGSGDTYVLHYDGSRFRGYGVLAEYRTAATALSTAKDSDAVAWRSSRWVSSAAKYRQWRMVARGDAGDSNNSFLSLYSKREEGSEYKIFEFEHLYGSISKFFVYGDGTGSVPAIGFTADPAGISPGSISCVLGPNGTDIDGTEIWFKHGDSTRHARWRFFGVDDETTGVAAEVLAVTYQQAASGGETIKVSPSFVHRAAAWNGSASVELAHYSQLIPTSHTAGYVEHGYSFGAGIHRFYGDGTFATSGAVLIGATAQEAAAYAQHVLTGTDPDPAGYLRHGFGYGPGTLDLYSDGGVLHTIDGSSTRYLGNTYSIRTSVPATVSSPSSTSPYFCAVARSGSGDADRLVGWGTQIDSDADLDDKWSMRFLALGDGPPAEILGVRNTGEIIPADGSAGVIELSAALGTHSGTTASDKTGNTKLGTLKVKLSTGATAHIQLYAD